MNIEKQNRAVFFKVKVVNHSKRVMLKFSYIQNVSTFNCICIVLKAILQFHVNYIKCVSPTKVIYYLR